MAAVSLFEEVLVRRALWLPPHFPFCQSVVCKFRVFLRASVSSLLFGRSSNSSRSACAVVSLCFNCCKVVDCVFPLLQPCLPKLLRGDSSCFAFFAVTLVFHALSCAFACSFDCSLAVMFSRSLSSSGLVAPSFDLPASFQVSFCFVCFCETAAAGTRASDARPCPAVDKQNGTSPFAQRGATSNSANLRRWLFDQKATQSFMKPLTKLSALFGKPTSSKGLF